MKQTAAQHMPDIHSKMTEVRQGLTSVAAQPTAMTMTLTSKLWPALLMGAEHGVEAIVCQRNTAKVVAGYNETLTGLPRQHKSKSWYQCW
jgi:hypothetical protein